MSGRLFESPPCTAVCGGQARVKGVYCCESKIIRKADLRKVQSDQEKRQCQNHLREPEA